MVEMNLLGNIINQYALPSYEAGDFADVISILNDKIIEETDDDLYTWAGIALLAGPQAAEQLRVALEGSGMGWAVHQFGGTGLQLSNPLVFAAMQQFTAAGIGLQPLLDHIKKNISPAEQVFGHEVVQQDIHDYRAYENKENVKRQGADTYNNWVTMVDRWDGIGRNPPTSTLGQ